MKATWDKGESCGNGLMPTVTKLLEEEAVFLDDDAVGDKDCVGRDEEMDVGLEGSFLGEDRVVCTKLDFEGGVRGLDLISSRMANHRERSPACEMVSGSSGRVI